MYLPETASYAPEMTLSRVILFRFQERIASEGDTYTCPLFIDYLSEQLTGL